MYKSNKDISRSHKIRLQSRFFYRSDREIPEYKKFVFSKCHISDSLKSIQKEYNIQPDLMKGEIDHDLISISKYKDYENLWRPYLIDNVLGLAYVAAKHGNRIQKITGVSYKNSLTEAALGWSCLRRYLKEVNKILYTHKNEYVIDFIKKTVHGGRVLACNKEFVSNSFTDVVTVLEELYGKDLEISVLFDKYFKNINTIKNYYKEKYEGRFGDYRRDIIKNLKNMLIEKYLEYLYQKN